MVWANDYRSYLQHHGVKGQKWYHRRYQNEDGSLTALGREHYKKRAVFISGSSKTEDESSSHYRKELPKDVKSSINSYIRNNIHINVGDAPGIDRQVQKYLKDKNYKNVTVYGPGKSVRHLEDPEWQTKPVNDPFHKEGSKEWLAKKDIAMTKDSSEGLAIVIDTGASATRNNVSRLMNEGKKVKVYELSTLTKNLDRWMSKDEIQNIQIPKSSDDLVKQYDMALQSLYRKQRSISVKATNGIDKINNFDEFYARYKNAVNSDAWQDLQKDITKINRMKNELKHHGVKGQKWGIQNGPPYPLKYEAHSAAEKKHMSKGKAKGLGGEDERKSGFVEKNMYGDGFLGHVARVALRLKDETFYDYTISRVEGSGSDLKRSIDSIQKEKTKKRDFDELVDKINPGYPEVGKTSNCAYCTAALEIAHRGYDVVAKSSVGGLYPEEIASLFKGSKMESFGTQKSLKESILKDGEGSSGALFVDLDFGGHAIHYHVKNGDVIITDAQSHDQFKMTPSAFKKQYGSSVNSFDKLRCDNHNIDWKAVKELEAVEPAKEREHKYALNILDSDGRLAKLETKKLYDTYMDAYNAATIKDLLDFKDKRYGKWIVE